MKNLEIKVKVDNFINTIKWLKLIGAKCLCKEKQIDIYFNVNGFKLKLRTIDKHDKVQFVWYLREKKSRMKISRYFILQLNKDKAKCIKNVLVDTIGKLVKVVKTRTVWTYKNTRIHLDNVKGLGKFIELETNFTNNQSCAKKEYNEIEKYLQLNKLKKYNGSYSDIMMSEYALIPPIFNNTL